MRDKSAEGTVFIVIFITNNLYYFLRELYLDFTSFLKLVNNFLPKTFLTDKDHAIIKAVDLILK